LRLRTRRDNPAYRAGKRPGTTRLFQQVDEAADNHDRQDDLHLGTGSELLEHLVLDGIQYGREWIPVGDNQRATENADNQRKYDVTAVDSDENSQ
jgi:hypothetical protein